MELPLTDAVKKVIGTPWRVNNFIYLDESIGFLYCAVPAAANIRTIGSLQKGVAEARGQAFEIADLKVIYNRNAGILDGPKQVGPEVFARMLEDESVFKFAFVRDPAERFAAVYRNQFSLNTRNNGQRVKLFEFLGMPLEENLSMLDLAEVLTEEDGLLDLVPPLIPQRRLTAFDLLDYDYIGHHERWGQDFANIAVEVFGHETPVFDPVKDLNADPEGSTLVSLVDDETRAALQQAYADDYDMIAEINERFPNGFAVE